MLFPGQGAQFVGMGADIHADEPLVRDLFARASEHLGMDLAALCFDGPDAELVKTENAQPAVTLVNIACFEVLRDRGFEPVATGGHSLGEYAALYAAGSIGFEDALDLVRQRGLFMQAAADANPGGMLAVLGLANDDVCRLLDEFGLGNDVQLANVNSPSETILTGASNALRSFAGIAEKAGAAKVLPLRVSGAWHSRYMHTAGARLAEVLANARIQDPAVPVVCNVTGRLYDSADDVRRRLVEQVSSPVQWIKCARTLLAEFGTNDFVEVGPGSTLTRLLQSIDDSVEVRPFGTASVS